MLKKLSPKQTKILIGTLSIWGIILIASGTTMKLLEKPVEKTKTELKVIQKRVATAKSNEIRLKAMELEINQPLSVNVKDYLENVEDIEEKILKELKLDTSMVNINQAGSYTYTITYKKKTYNGIFKIKEKPLPDMALTLKSLNLEVGSALDTDIQAYIVEPLVEEIKANIKLNVTSVNTAQAGNYQYTVTYNGRLYTGTITIYQPQLKPTPTPSPTPTETPTDNKNETELS